MIDSFFAFFGITDAYREDFMGIICIVLGIPCGAYLYLCRLVPKAAARRRKAQIHLGDGFIYRGQKAVLNPFCWYLQQQNKNPETIILAFPGTGEVREVYKWEVTKRF